MCVSARREAEVYAKRLRVPLGRFRFIPWHTNVLEPRMSPPVADYLFAAGRTGRDWRTLAVALQGISTPVTVVCSRPEATNIPFPENVTVLTDIPYHRYRELLEGAKVVLVPLEPHTYSSGQVVILEAMALGKPVITTRVLGTEDYIDDGLDGMLVSPGNPAELRDAIVRMLSTWGLAERLGRAALDESPAFIHTRPIRAQYRRRCRRAGSESEIEIKQEVGTNVGDPHQSAAHLAAARPEGSCHQRRVAGRQLCKGHHVPAK